MRALLAAALLALPALALPWPAQALACPLAPPSALLQNDAGSGRDAGAGEMGAVPLRRDGFFWGSLDPPVQHGFSDISDWYVVDVPPGARAITVEIKSLGKVLAPGASWPLVYWLEVFRPGVGAVAFRGSWEAPVSFESPGGERLWLVVYLAPLVWDEACSPAGGGAGLGALPGEPQLYRARFECAPACFE